MDGRWVTWWMLEAVLAELTALSLAAYLLGATVLLHLVACAASRCVGQAHGLPTPAPPSLNGYVRREHLLLSIIWSEPMYPKPGKFTVTRQHRGFILATVFLMKFVIVSVLTLRTPPFPDCNACMHARDLCLEGLPATGCDTLHYPNSTFTAEELASLNNPAFVVGFNTNLVQFAFHTSAGNVSTEIRALLASARDTSPSTAEAKACWLARRNVSLEGTGVIRGRFRNVAVDGRLWSDGEDEDEDGLSLVCFDPAFVAGASTLCDVSIFLSLDLFSFASRVAFVSLVMLPVSYILKKLLKLSANGTGWKGCIRVSLGYPLLLLLLIFCFALAMWNVLALQGELFGDFSVSFMTTFLLGLLLDCPKLAVLYYCWKKKRLEAKYYSYAEQFAKRQGSHDKMQGEDISDRDPLLPQKDDFLTSDDVCLYNEYGNSKKARFASR